MPDFDGTPRETSTTRDALLRIATRFFGERGYAGTSLDAVVTAAGVTKGALYHHFKGKRDLFSAVFENLELTLMATNARLTGGSALAERHADGLRLYLEVARDPHYVQIVLRDAPAVLGWTAQEPTQRPGFPVLNGLVRRVVGPERGLDEATLTMLTRMLFAGVLSAAQSVAHADDQEEALRVAERGLHLMITAIHQVGRSDADLDALASGYSG